MKFKLFLYTSLVLCATVLSVADEVLDEKLNALKKNARRRVYSASATLENAPELTVPRDASEEEQALDKKLREMEEKLNTQSDSAIRPVPLQRAHARPAQKKAVNWLTPELLNEGSEESALTQEPDDSWILKEMTRQKTLKEERLIKQEERQLANQRLLETLRQQQLQFSTTYSDDPQTLQNVFSGNSASQNAPYGKQAAEGLKASKSTDSTFSRLSTSPSRDSTSLYQQPNSSFESRLPTSSPGFRADSSDQFLPAEPEAAPELLRNRTRRAPSYDKNPFEDDPTKSIWN